MTIKDMRAAVKQRLYAAGIERREADEMADRIVCHAKGYKPVDLVLHAGRELLPETEQRIMRQAERVAQGEPLQYVLGTAHWRGRDFAVTPATLIPRPETQGLVDMIADDLRGACDPRILDIGTGTGCIAISLALDVPFAQVEAIDISPAAIEVAKANAAALHARVDFSVADALALPANAPRAYDAIVSNPPYVLCSERDCMDARVVDYEPSSALFVPDADPLLFYTAIADYALSALLPGGMLYFEINPLMADAMAAMLQGKGYAGVEILRDYLGKKRFAIAKVSL